MGKCKKCSCSGFFWNPVSFGQKLMSGTKLSDDKVIKGSIQLMEYQDNKSN